MSTLDRKQHRIQEDSDQALRETISDLHEQLPVFNHDSELQQEYDKTVTQLRRTQKALHVCIQAIRYDEITEDVRKQIERFKGLL